MSLLQKNCKLQESLFLESLLDNRSALPEDLPISLSISLIRDVYTYSSLHTPTPGCNATIEHPEPRTCYLPCLLVNHRQDQLVVVSDGGDGGGGDDWRMLVYAVVVVVMITTATMTMIDDDGWRQRREGWAPNSRKKGWMKWLERVVDVVIVVVVVTLGRTLASRERCKISWDCSQRWVGS